MIEVTLLGTGSPNGIPAAHSHNLTELRFYVKCRVKTFG
jgi:hypothetical protein